jgi:hypothetical protein
MTIQIDRKSKSLILPIGMKEFVSDLKHKVIEDCGKSFVAVKYDLNSYKKLKDCGLDIPHPIDTIYDWPKLANRYDPMPHQKVAARFMVDNKRCFNLSEPRTGKTFSIMLAFDYLRKSGQARRMVIYSTLSTVTTVWQQIVWESFQDYTCGVIHGGKEKIEEMLSYNFDVLVINHDGCKNKAIQKYIQEAKDIDIIAWDEADVLSSAQSAMWKTFRDSIKPQHRLILATGTPTGENPLSAFALTKLVSPDNIPKYFGAWRNMVMYQISQFTYKARKEANTLVHKAMQPAICFRKSEVLTLPELTNVRIECELSAEQKKMYDSMRKDMLMEHSSGDKVLALSASDKVLKLLQIGLGAYRTGEKEYQELDCQPRIDAIMECIGKTPQKSIVFCPFRGAMALYYREIGKHYSCEMVNGDTSKKERDRIFTEFQNSSEPHVLLAHPQICAHGLEMAAADTIIWAAPSQRGLHFLQANERIASALQKHPMTIFYIGATPIEWKRFDSLIAKRDDQSALLDLYKEILADRV